MYSMRRCVPAAVFVECVEDGVNVSARCALQPKLLDSLAELLA